MPRECIVSSFESKKLVQALKGVSAGKQSIPRGSHISEGVVSRFAGKHHSLFRNNECTCSHVLLLNFSEVVE